ncbi:cytochrome B [Streptomyces carminius]|uniref:Cytochrome B n=1 Tax=Streptomyces carminius TaxID=2665496 RepID=A0A2M8M2K5_9ACTN|nr:COX15/CtaA family protein [Streptomyces carminius]PJE98427.1 cytochrome B [Streptomyces carminius]
MPNLLEFARNPVAYVARRWTPAQRTVELAALTALVMSVVIVVTGGVVRLTGSGLGCETWPKCSGDSLIATPEMGLHGAIEFGNRLLTYVLSAAVGWAIVAARSAEPRRRPLTRLAWSQFWLVLANALMGGVTVLMELNPYTVATHFLLATVLLTLSTLTWLRAREGDEEPRPLAGPRAGRLAAALTAVTAALIAVGTVVTGAGPHAGDSSDVPRMGVDWESVTRVHALLAWTVVALAVALWAVLRAAGSPPGPLARTRELLVVLLAQGAIGYVQYLTELPEVLVALHLLGSTLVWIAVLRVVLALRERGLPPVAAVPVPDSVPGSAPDQSPAAPAEPVTGPSR